VLGNWGNIPGLIPEEDILEMFRNKYKRSGKAILHMTLTEMEDVA